MTREYQVEKMLDELEEEFAKANMPVNDKLTLFAKVSNIIYKYVEQEPCTDAISREELLRAIDTWDKFGYTETGCFVREPKGDYVPYIHYDDVINCIKSMPPVTPQYTDAEIQRMQELEQAEIQKAYEIGKAENIEVLDKIRAEFISLYPKNYAGELELGGASCVFSLYKVLSIIDKYKASPTGAEEENE